MSRWKTLDDLIFPLALVVRFLIFVAVLIHNFRFFFVIGSFLHGEHGSATLSRRTLLFSKDIPTRILLSTLHDHGRSL